MEPIADIIPRAMNGIRRSSPPVPSNDAASPPRPTSSRRPHPRTLGDLVEVLREREAHENPDAVVPVQELRLTPEGLLEVPKLGAFQFNDYSRWQASAMTGLKWDRWFAHTSGAEQAEEMNRRFARGRGELRLRSRRALPDETLEVEGTAGVLTACLSSTYTPVPDSIVAERLLAKLEDHAAVEVVRFDLTIMTTTYVLKLGDAYQKGTDVHAEVGALWGCLAIRNSGVGASSLSVTLSLMRLLCKNGMHAPVRDAVVFKKAHRHLDVDAISARLDEGLQDVGPRLHRSTRTLVAALRRAVPNVEEELKVFLSKHRLPQKHLKPLLTAYAREPKANAFGLSQAMTLMAQELSPEERFELERAAGRYLTRFSEEA